MLSQITLKITQLKFLLLKDQKVRIEQPSKEQKKKSSRSFSTKSKRLTMEIKLFHKFKMIEQLSLKPISLTLKNRRKSQFSNLKVILSKWSITNQTTKNLQDLLKRDQIIILRLILNLFMRETLCKKKWNEEWLENKRFLGALKKRNSHIESSLFNFMTVDKLNLNLKDRLKSFKNEK